MCAEGLFVQDRHAASLCVGHVLFARHVLFVRHIAFAGFRPKGDQVGHVNLAASAGLKAFGSGAALGHKHCQCEDANAPKSNHGHHFFAHNSDPFRLFVKSVNQTGQFCKHVALRALDAAIAVFPSKLFVTGANVCSF